MENDINEGQNSGQASGRQQTIGAITAEQ